MKYILHILVILFCSYTPLSSMHLQSDSRLHTAILQNKPLEELKKLLSPEYNINSLCYLRDIHTKYNVNGSVTPLHVAILTNQKKTVRFLLRKKANIEALTQCNPVGEQTEWASPLRLAIQHAHPFITKILLKKKADVDTSKIPRKKLINIICLKSTYAKNKKERRHWRIKMIYLAQADAILNQPHNSYKRPLRITCKNDPHMFRLLITLGAQKEPNLRSRLGFKTFEEKLPIYSIQLCNAHTLKEKKLKEIIKKIGNKVCWSTWFKINRTADKKTLLHKTIENKQFDTATAYLKIGANPNIRDKQGNTPTHLACQSYSLCFLQNLALLSKPDFMKKDKKGLTGFDLLFQRGELEAINLLTKIAVTTHSHLNKIKK